MQEGYGKENTKYACVGYCFGAPYVCDELAGNTVAVGAFAHPAFLKEHHFTNLKSKRCKDSVGFFANQVVVDRALVPILFGD